MQNLQINEEILQHFQIEELEERLENKWGCETTTTTTNTCTGETCTTYTDC